MDCFGVFSFFSINGDRCRSCPRLPECMRACYDELRTMQPQADVKKLLTKHIKLMQKLQVSGAEDIKSDKEETSYEVTRLGMRLEKEGLIKSGWISRDLTKAPPFFRICTEFLYKIKETTDDKLVRHVQDCLNDPTEANSLDKAVTRAAITVQVLAGYNIIKVIGRKITWISTNSESGS